MPASEFTKFPMPSFTLSIDFLILSKLEVVCFSVDFALSEILFIDFAALLADPVRLFIDSVFITIFLLARLSSNTETFFNCSSMFPDSVIRI